MIKIRSSPQFIIFVFFSIAVILSCNTDIDLIYEISKHEIEREISIDDSTDREEDQSNNDTIEDEDSVENNQPDNDSNTDRDSVMIEHSTKFKPIHDVYLQSGIGYDSELIRLDNFNRVSYIKFDLSPIDSLSGVIVGADLYFTINSDNGDGTIEVFKGNTSDWSENTITDADAPNRDEILGSIEKEYIVGNTEKISLNSEILEAGVVTLILIHEGGNDLAFASKEHSSTTGPQLTVRYEIPEGETAVPDQINTGENPSDEDNDVNSAPISVATSDISEGNAPLVVTFDGSKSTDDKGIKTYLWEFGDNSTSNSINPTYTFENNGSYNVTLTVTNEANLSHSTTLVINVTSQTNQPPKAVAKSDKSSGIAPLEVTFNADSSSDDKSIEKYLWHFDVDSTTSKNPTHTFNTPGTYEVELTVTDADGAIDTDTLTINVSEPVNEPPKAEATANVYEGDAPLQVNFSANGSSDDKEIASYYWNFGINDPSSSISPTRTFEIPGVYSVSLTVTDTDGEKDTESITITVNEQSTNSDSPPGNYPSGGVKASSYGFNASDATDAFMAAINSNNDVIVIDKQSSDWIIGPVRFFNLSNKTIYIESDVIIRSKSGAFPNENDGLIEILNSNNVTIEGYGATLKMNKSEYNSGEWRHGLSIVGCSNVEVRGLKILDSGGDGVYIAGTEANSYSDNIIINDVLSSNNRRQGMSIVSAQNVWVNNSEFNWSNGVEPENGVDLEPNNANDRLVNINFQNCKFANNNREGFKISLAKLKSYSLPISISVRNSEFSFNGRRSIPDHFESEIYVSSDLNSPVKGEILFDNILFNGSDVSVLFSRNNGNGFQTIFRNCKAIDILKNSSQPPIALDQAGGSNSLGGFTFDNFYLEYNKNESFLRLRGSIDTNLKNINGTFTIREPYNNDVEYGWGITPSKGINFNINYSHLD